MLRTLLISMFLASVGMMPAASAAAQDAEPSCGLDLSAADELRGADAGCNVPVVGRVVLVAGSGLSRDCDPNGPNIIVMVGFDNEVSC